MCQRCLTQFFSNYFNPINSLLPFLCPSGTRADPVSKILEYPASPRVDLSSVFAGKAGCSASQTPTKEEKFDNLSVERYLLQPSNMSSSNLSQQGLHLSVDLLSLFQGTTSCSASKIPTKEENFDNLSRDIS